MEGTVTEIKKNEQVIRVVPCFKMIEGKIMKFRIEGTDKYYMRNKKAIQCADEMLLKEALPEKQYLTRVSIKKRLLHCNRIIRVNDCHKDTQHYIERWTGVLYLETKKKLCKEIKAELAMRCKEGGFKNAAEAIAFKKYHTELKQNRK